MKILVTSLPLILLQYLLLNFKIANYFAIETLFLIILNSFYVNKFCKVIILLLCLCNSLEFVNASFVGGYIEPLTLENLDCASSIGLVNVIKLCLIFVVYFTLLIKSKLNFIRSKYQYFFIFICFLLVDNSSKKFPCKSFFYVSKVAIKNYFYVYQFGNGDIFKKDVVLKDGSSWNEKSLKNHNMLLLFTEGTSLRVISKDLTPNAYQLMEESIVFDNYYNHTAATFRGIRGALISGVQYLGGYYSNKNGLGQVSKEKLKKLLKQRPESLQQILKDNGYYTIFISPHADMHFNNFINELGGFDKIVQGNDLTDKELYETIFEEYELATKQSKPFLLVSYILGTHEGMDSPDIKYGDGKNPYLNKFHNQDVWFGKFFDKYKNTSSFDKTLLVYTTDHCTHSSKGYNSTFNYSDIDWIDTIPLFIYNPHLKHKVYDANGLTSLTLTPTLLDMLGIHNVSNHFLGHSLFEIGSHDSIEYQRFLGESCNDTKTKKELDFKKDCQPAEKFYMYAG